MIEVKFRAKSTNTGKFVYGFFGYDWDSKGNLMPCIQHSLTDMKTSFSRTVIDIDTLSQFTGVLDKNRKEIYGSDIVQGYWGWMRGDGRLKKGYPDKIRKWFEVKYDTRHGNAGFKLHEIKVHPEDQFAADEYFYRSVQTHLSEDRECELKNNEVQWKGICESLEVIGNIYENPELL